MKVTVNGTVPLMGVAIKFAWGSFAPKVLIYPALVKVSVTVPSLAARVTVKSPVWV